MRLRLWVRVEYVMVAWLVWALPWLWLASLVSEAAKQRLWWPLFGYGTWRGLSVRVRETPDGLRVRNIGRTHRLSWEDVAAVEWGDTWAGVHASVPVLRRREGRRVPVLALGHVLFPSRRDKEAVCRWEERIGAARPDAPAAP